MIRFKYLIYICCITFMSCADFLEEYSPDQSYIRSYKDLDELLIGEGYMATSYNNLSSGYYPYIHMMADETRENNIEIEDYWEEDFNRFQQKYFGYVTWQYRVGYTVDKLSTNKEDEDWNKLYKHINIANMILWEIDKQEANTDEARQAVKRIRGEAYFLRAAYYFTLTNLYGTPYVKSTASQTLGVPIKTSPVIEDHMFPRETLEADYNLILSDLEKAADNLKDIPRKSVYRAGITAVRLLQSRVYLYMQNWDKAAEYAQMCLSLQSTLTDMNTMVNDESSEAFATADSPEVIFSMGNNNISLMLTNLFAGLSASEGLKACYQRDDLRTKFFLSPKDDSSYWICNKYVKLNATNNPDVSDNFMFRTAEAWLNLAEASACKGDEQTAKQALEELRKNRIELNSYKAIEKNGDELINEIRQERRRELCFEGHRWFDLRRYTVSEKAPFTGSIRNTYTDYGDWSVNYIQTYELKAGDPSWTLQIPYEVVQFEQLTPNPRNERAPIATSTTGN